jgi:hypothetical protein
MLLYAPSWQIRRPAGSAFDLNFHVGEKKRQERDPRKQQPGA